MPIHCPVQFSQNAGLVCRCISSLLSGHRRVAGRDAEAIPLYENLMLDPTFAAPVIRARTLVLIADIYEKIGKKPDATARYRDALKLDATNLDASVGLKRVAP